MPDPDLQNPKPKLIAKRRRVGLLILGMHRSGTSALARVVSLLGADLPSNLMPADIGNELGHWESNSIAALNESILASAGSCWDDWLPFHEAWYDSPVHDDFAEKAKETLVEEFGGAPLFVLKDPRICRLARFWLNVLQSEAIEPRVVLPIRSPLEVADSLVARDGCDFDYAMLVWLRNVLDAEFATRDFPRCFVSFDQLLSNWEYVTSKIEKELNVSWPRSPFSARAEISSFLDPDHRHYSRNAKSVIHNVSMSAWTRDAYQALVAMAEEGESVQHQATLDRINAEFSSASPVFAGMLKPGSRFGGGFGEDALARRDLEKQVEQAERRLSSLASLEDQFEARDKDLSQSRDEQAKLGRMLRDKDEFIAKLEAELSNAKEGRHQQDLRIADLEAQHVLAANLDAALKAEVEASNERQQQLSAKNAELVRTGEEISALRRLSEEQFQQLTQSINENKKLADDLKEQYEKSTKLEREFVAAASSRDEFKRLADLKESERQNMANEIARLEGIAQDAGHQRAVEVNQLKEQLRELEEALDTLAVELKVTKEMLADRESALRQRQEEAYQAWSELSAERTAKEAYLQEIERLDRHNADLLDHLAQKDSKFMVLVDELRSLETELAKTRTQSHESKIAAVALETQNADISDLLQERSAELAQLTSLLHDRDAEFRNAERNIQSLEAQIRMLSGELERRGQEQEGETEEQLQLLHERAASLEAERDTITASQRETERHLSERFSEVAALTQALTQVVGQSARWKQQAEWVAMLTQALSGHPAWWNLLPAKLRRKQQLRFLQKRGIFDGDAYLSRNPDVAEAGQDPLHHYIFHGMGEGRTL